MQHGDSHTLPALRYGLQLLPAGHCLSGAPGWVLYDSSIGRYFDIGWAEREFIANWSLGSIKKLVDHINRYTPLHVNNDDIVAFINFLRERDLVACDPNTAAPELYQRYQTLKQQRLLQNFRRYLFCKCRLVRPDAFLTATLPYVKGFFSPLFFYCMLVLAAFALYGINRQWASFTHTFWYFFNLEGMAYYVLATLLVKLIHELGHAYTCKHFGARVNSMGIVLLVFWPVAYTDTTEAWRLTEPRQRLWIDAAGVIAELAVAIFAAVLWCLLSDGPLRSAMFALTTLSLVSSLLVNANPCMRFDGYYFLSDLLRVKNLQQRAFSLGIWRLREWITGLGDPKPEHFSPRMEKGLIFYAYITWIYRFFVFLGIALIIYFFFFKALGLALMVIELYMFIVSPIKKELAFYWGRRKDLRWNKHTSISIGLLIALSALFLVPWKHTVQAPAMISYQKDTRLFAVRAAQVVSINVARNAHVKKGHVLFTLHSDELAHDIENVRYDIDIIHKRLDAELGKEDELGHRQADSEELVSQQKKLAGLQALQSELTVRAPFAGQVKYLSDDLIVGAYLKQHAFLAEVIAPDESMLIQAFVPETILNRVQADKPSIFYPDDMRASKMTCRITDIDFSRSKALPLPYLASNFGGPIAVEQDPQHADAFKIKESLYRISMTPVKSNAKHLQRIMTGHVVLQVKPESFAHTIAVKALSLLIGESDF